MPNPDSPEGSLAQGGPVDAESTLLTGHKSEHAKNVEKAIADMRPARIPDEFTRVQAVEPIRRFFEYSHLPPHLQQISEPFSVLADRILQLPASAERSVALRKLLESKDATVRAALPG